MEIAALAAIGVLAVVILLIAAARHGRRTDVFADVVAFEQARRALARDVPAASQAPRPDVTVTDERRTA